MKWTCPPCPCPCWAPGLTDLRASYYCQCQLIWPDHQCTLGMFWGPRNFYQNTFMTHSQSWHAREREREPERAFIQVWRQTHRQRYYKVKYWLLAWANNCIIFGCWVSIFNLHNWFEASEEMWIVKAPINTVTLSHIGQGPGSGRSSSECVRSQLYFLRMETSPVTSSYMLTRPFWKAQEAPRCTESLRVRKSIIFLIIQQP